MAKLTLFGMARYMDEHNDDLFESFSQLPEGVDKNTLIDAIMLEGGEFQVLYTDPYFLKNRITYWMSKHKRTFDKWWEALNLEYEPLWNYDRHEEWTDHNEGETTRTNSDTMTGGNSSEVVETLTGTGTKASTNVVDEDTTTTGESESSASESTTTSTNSTTTNTVSAYNSSVYEPDNKSEIVSSGTTSGTSSGTTESSTTGTRDETDTYNENTSQNTTDRTVTTGTNNQTNTGSGSGTSENDSTHDGHLYGNIGLTTSMALLKEQLDVVTWNIYSHIADLFISEFCITLYF